MLSVRVIPLLLFRRDGLYKGIGFRDHKYVGDVLNAVRIFAQKQAHEVILLDIAATAEGRSIALDLVSRVAQECMMPLTVGGGITDAATAQALLNAGAEKVTLNSHALAHPDIIGEIAALSGNQSVIAAIDVGRGDNCCPESLTHCGNRWTGRHPVGVAGELVAAGAGEILLTSVDRDGTGQGFDLEVIAEVAEAVSVPVIACGGAGELSHFRDAVAAGAAAVAAGSLFVFHGRRRAVLISYPDGEELSTAFGEDVG